MKIAVIGSGISGLTAAWMLAKEHQVTLYERQDYFGGHSCTIDIQLPNQQKIPVDIGFIVFNYRTYPGLKKFFEYLQVPVVKSDMSFGVSIGNQLEYGSHHMLQWRNLRKASYLRMLYDILRFNRQAQKFLQQEDNTTSLQEYMTSLRVGKWFYEYYLLPMMGAIWSNGTHDIQKFPAQNLLRFFDNHGLLTVGGRPQWYSVQNGSREYVKRILQDFNGTLKLSCAVKKVTRHKNHIEVLDNTGNIETYEGVIFASHADQTLQMLDNPTQDESDILGSFNYQSNQIIVHSDRKFMPKNLKAWASWVYRQQQEDAEALSNINVSYWMNNLQNLATQTPIIVSLNPETMPDASLIWHQAEFDHPLLSRDAVQAQQKIQQIQGKDRIWYVGAYQQYGFHEDGLQSAVKMVQDGFGITPSWEEAG